MVARELHERSDTQVLHARLATPTPVLHAQAATRALHARTDVQVLRARTVTRDNQSIEFYHINKKLHDMIRNSPHNTRAMESRIDEDKSDDSGEDSSDLGEDVGEDEDSFSGSQNDSDNVPISTLFD